MMIDNWKERFIKLYMADSSKDFSESLDIKRLNLPTKLYRYRSFPTLEKLQYVSDEISKGEIYLSRPEEFNDPYDSHSLLSSQLPAYYCQNAEDYKKAMRNHFDENTLAKVFKSENWYDELIQLVAKHIERDDGVDANMVTQSLANAVMKQIEDINIKFNTVTCSLSRVSCFTECNLNLPMWAHYADSHKGACLEYDLNNIDNIYIKNRLFPVYYVDRLPDFTHETFAMKKSKLPFGLLDYYLIHKLDDWKYEKEWRLLFNVGSWYLNPQDIPPEFYKSGRVIPFIFPSKIFLGYKIEPAKEKEIRLAADKCRIPVEKMNITAYGLRSQ